jgi:hypothetical protein
MKILKPNFSIDFTKPNSINTLLGFDSKVYSKTENVSENIIQITEINDIDIYCDLITSNSYVNGERKSILYSLSAYNVPVGAKVIISEIDPIYLPINAKTIASISFQIRDDKGKLLDLKGETFIIECILRERRW